jgi:hypothetical protein
MQARHLIYILWPSFIVAAGAEAMFFTVFDPHELTLFGEPLQLSRITTYSVGFFVFWAFAAASSFLTCFFQKTSAEINRCPIAEPRDRPIGCPKRFDENASC